MRTIPTYGNDNYISDANLLKRKSFYNYFKPKIDLVKKITGLVKLKGRERILDVGCGAGDTLIQIRKKYGHRGEMFGIDISPGILSVAQAANAQTRSGISFLVGDGRSLNFPGDYFDIVIVKHVLHNVRGYDKLLDECRRTLKVGGRLVIVLSGKRSRLIQKRLKPKMAGILGLDFFPEAESTVSLENIKQHFDRSLWDRKVVKLVSRLNLRWAQPYLDYIDSGRDFWGQVSDAKWVLALKFCGRYFERWLSRDGSIRDISTVGIVVATKR